MNLALNSGLAIPKPAFFLSKKKKNKKKDKN